MFLRKRRPKLVLHTGASKSSTVAVRLVVCSPYKNRPCTLTLRAPWFPVRPVPNNYSNNQRLYRADISTKRPRWNAGAASWRLHRAHTAKPQMTLRKLIFYSMQPRVPLDRALCRHYCLLVRLSSSAECVRRRRVTGAVTSVRSACCWEEVAAAQLALLRCSPGFCKRLYG